VLPKITELELNTDQIAEDLPKIGKSFLFDFEKGEFVLREGKPVVVEGIEALKVWITKAIKTEKYRFKIYDDTNYGTTLEGLIGTKLPRQFIESEVKREVISSLTTHPYIQDIVNWEFIRDGTFMRIKFKVVTVEGTFEQEVTL
jgi:hypothetical protein